MALLLWRFALSGFPGARSAEGKPESAWNGSALPAILRISSVADGGGPRDREQPSAPCAPSTWGGPVPRFLAMMDTQWGVSAWSASTGTGRHRGGPFGETDRKE